MTLIPLTATPFTLLRRNRNYFLFGVGVVLQFLQQFPAFFAPQIAHFDEANYGHVSSLTWAHQDVAGSCLPEAAATNVPKIQQNIYICIYI